MLNDAELTQFTELAKKFEAGNKDAVLAIVKTHMHPVFQDAHDQGHSAATRKSDAKVLELTTAKTETETKMAEIQRKLDDLNGKAPDVVKVRGELEQQMKDLQETHKKDKAALKETLKEERLDRAREALVKELALTHGVDEEYAELVLSKRPEVIKRFRPNEQGVTEVLQAGKDIPFTPTEGKTGVQLLAAELVSTVPDKFVGSKVNRGSGVRGERGGAGEGKGSRFDQAREDVKARNEGAKKGATGRSGLDRLGGRREVST